MAHNSGQVRGASSASGGATMEAMPSFLQRLKLRSKEFLAELNDYPDGYDMDASSLAYEEQQLRIANVLAVASAFRAAFTQFQVAHAPLDADAVRAADRAAVAQLRQLSELRRANPAVKDTRLEAQVHERQCVLKTYELVLNRLEAEIRSKDAEVDAARAQLQALNRSNAAMERRLKQPPPEPLSVGLFVESVRRASVAAQRFTRMLLELMCHAQWDIDCAARSIQPEISFAKESHQKYAFESYLCLGMFGGFESEDFYVNGGMSSVLDLERHRLDCFMEYEDMMKAEDAYRFLDGFFGKFCHKKYLQIVHPRMEESFFGNLDHRDLVSEGGHPRTEFYEGFLKLAKAVWLVHRLAYSFDPAARIFQVRRGVDFSSVLMESVVPGRKFLRDRPKVGFTVMPGFRVENAVIQCQVYPDAAPIG